MNDRMVDSGRVLDEELIGRLTEVEGRSPWLVGYRWLLAPLLASEAAQMAVVDFEEGGQLRGRGVVVFWWDGYGSTILLEPTEAPSLNQVLDGTEYGRARAIGGVFANRVPMKSLTVPSVLQDDLH